MTLLKLDLQSPIGTSGDFLRRTEVYTAEADTARGTWTFWQMYADKSGVMHRGSCGYSGYESAVQFAAARQAENDKAAANTVKRREEDAAEARRREIAQPAVDAIRAAFDLSDRQWEWDLWGRVGEQAGANLLDHVGEAMSLPPSRRGPVIRKLLRSAMAEAKAMVREDYPEDYREAEDKEDFYTDYLSDIAEAISLEVQA